MRLRLLTIAAWAFALAMSAASVHAQSKAAIDANVADALAQFNALDVRHEELERRAAGILIFPSLVKGGIGLANEYGAGALQVGGVTVGYYSMASASVGLTAGMAEHREIILFMTPDALRKFQSSHGWAVGADTGIAVATKGAADDYDSLSLTKPVLRFVFGEKGLMADVSFSGTKINRIAK